MRLQNGIPAEPLNSQVTTQNKKPKNMNKSSLSKSHRFKDIAKDPPELKDVKDNREPRDLRYKAPEKITHGRKMSDFGVGKLKPKGV